MVSVLRQLLSLVVLMVDGDVLIYLVMEQQQLLAAVHLYVAVLIVHWYFVLA